MEKLNHSVGMTDPLSARAFAGIPCWACNIRECFYVGEKFYAFSHTVYGVTKAEATAKAEALVAALTR